jgi:hypothetical protein
MVLGGGGSPSPMPELALQLLFALLLGLWLLWVPPGRSRGSRDAWIVAMLLLAVPVLQLVPLPPALWHGLPGRGLERDSLALVGGETGWRPLSVAPARTMASLLALVPPAALVVLLSTLGRQGRNMVVGTIAGVGLLALLVGFAQFAASRAGGSHAFRFYTVDVGYLNGFQANHNAAADVLLIAMVAQTAIVSEWFRLHRPGQRCRAEPILAVGLAVPMSIGVFLTASRAGTFLLPLAWLWMAAILLPQWGITRRQIGRGVAAAAGLAGAVALAIGASDMGRRILSRYDFSGELRLGLWADALLAARTYFPWGAGIGTFVPVFLAAERLEVVYAPLPNRAHADFLELMIEAGVPGFLVLAAIAAILGGRAIRALQGRSEVPVIHACFSLGTLSIVAMHSLVDYPLRSMSVACLGGIAAGILLPPPLRAMQIAHATMKERR